MTPEERADWIVSQGTNTMIGPAYNPIWLKAQVLVAIAEKREACAVTAEDLEEHLLSCLNCNPGYCEGYVQLRIAEEREACAQMVDGLLLSPMGGPAALAKVQAVAAAIRGRE